MKLKDLETKYDFLMVEDGKYEKWLKEGYFKAGDISKRPYTVVIPPPNITGKLHIGHVLDNTLQDIIIRRKRMQGYDALFLPGMDHASIATQVKVEEMLAKDGISRYDLGRDEFLKVCWKWKEDHANIIHDQWKKVGISVDYTRERFTLDEGLNKAVNEVFVKMYNDGLIYHGEKIINWDIKSMTALSNVEVEYKDIEGAFYHIFYPLADGSGSLEIATTRPETMFGDTALMVHPKDERYKDFIGKDVIIPFANRKIKVISDEYVDMEFGTGVVKVTPAHDPNDFEVGCRHNLERLICMTEDGHMNSLACKYEGQDRFECRKNLVNDLRDAGYLGKVEKMVHSVGHSQRTGVIVEPRLSKQWFVKMQPLVDMVFEMQRDPDKKVNFYPARFEQTFNQWLENIQDWCISRQLWWGHQIPAWYKKNEDGKEEVYVGMTAPTGDGWKRDEDALDTWFSSALWPFSTLGWPDKTNDYERFYPTDCLVTGYDIIFFWVARMVFQGKYLTDKRPFKDVLIHGLIRDELGRKISKTLGNGVDIYEAFKKYGVDSVRYFLATAGTVGQDIRYSDEKLEATWNYFNKIWNISRYIGIQLDANNYQNEEINPKLLNTIDKWVLTKLNNLIKDANYNFDKYEFGEAGKAIYNFVWNDFASWYLEMTKVIMNGNNSAEKINTCATLAYVLRSILKLLHPYAPFVTDQIYSMFNEENITISSWPIENENYNFKDAIDTEKLFDVITSIRNTRALRNVSISKPISLILKIKNQKLLNFIDNNKHYLQRFTNYSDLHLTLDDVNTDKCEVSILNDITIIIPLESLINLDEEIEKLKMEKEKMMSEIKRCEMMLNNPNFVAKAPKEKVDSEKSKLNEYQERLNTIIYHLEELQK